MTSEIWTPLKLVAWTKKYFEKKGIPNPRLDAELLLAHCLNVSRVDLYIHFERPVEAGEMKKFRECVQRRATREPLQYIINESFFYGRRFHVTPDVLIPRPETEILAEKTLSFLRKEKKNPLKILDIGTGSGCLAITLALEETSAEVTATDLSEKALAVARKNAGALGVLDRICFLKTDLFPASGTFDVIVSNPPYIATSEITSLQKEVSQFEPHLALDGGRDGVDCFQHILAQASSYLKEEGILVMEMGENQAGYFKALKHPTLSVVSIEKDLEQKERFVWIKRLESHTQKTSISG